MIPIHTKKNKENFEMISSQMMMKITEISTIQIMTSEKIMKKKLIIEEKDADMIKTIISLNTQEKKEKNSMREKKKKLEQNNQRSIFQKKIKKQ